MRWFGWWRKPKIQPPGKIEMPRHEKPGNHSAVAARESEKKLYEAINTRKEVSQVIKASDQFAEALQQSMRRSHG